MTETVRIAMWSGPRNLSTAMMRSFGARADTVCADEPFYAPFLKLTGLDHPMREEILMHHPTDPNAVAREMAAGLVKAPIVYQKHMTHHMVEGVPLAWMAQVRHAFLIRHPARVLASYAKKMEAVTLEATGFSRQAELFEYAGSLSGQIPVVIDSDRILANPETELRKLCNRLEIAFDPAMLAWAPGPKPEDGVWAPHWYDAVYASSGFGPPPTGPLDVSTDLQGVLNAALPFYERLAAFA